MASKQLLSSVLRLSKTSYQIKSLTLVHPSLLRVNSRHATTSTSYTRERKLAPGFKPRSIAPRAMELNRRRQRVAIDEKLRYGQEKVVKRSQFTDWNYPAEISAFQARLGEQFDEEKLLQAFKTREYLEDLTLQRRETFGIEKISFHEQEDEFHTKDSESDINTLNKKDLEEIEADSNQSLSMVGSNFIVKTLKAFVRTALPYIPEEGVEAITDFLTSDEMLARIAFHIGTKDLILSKEYPPSQQTYANVFRALAGALSLSESAFQNTNKERAMKFVVEIVGSQLHGQDITEIWDLENPVRVLEQVLTNEKRSLPEFRLLWVNGQDTILACYHIGVYCEKELIGQSPGETVEIAQDLAARDALRKLFRFDDCSTPVPFQMLKSGRQMLKNNPNACVKDWSATNMSNLVTV